MLSTAIVKSGRQRRRQILFGPMLSKTNATEIFYTLSEYISVSGTVKEADYMFNSSNLCRKFQKLYAHI